MVLLTALHSDSLSGEKVRVKVKVMFMSMAFFHVSSKEKMIAFEDWR
jgi:hypothetical protein